VSQRLIATVVFAASAAWLLPQPTAGQINRASVSRPSTSGPSVTIGRTGGDITRQTGYATSLSRTAGVNTLQRGLPAINNFGAAPGMPRAMPAPIPQAFTWGTVGYQARLAPLPEFGAIGTYSTMELQRASRLQQSMSLAVPLSGIRSTAIRPVQGPYYAPASQPDAFNDFFGLTPADQQWVERSVPPDGIIGLLEQENERVLAQRRAQALAAFRLATTPGVEDPAQTLSEAERSLMAVHNLDPSDHVASLLLIHVALQRQQTLRAIRHLVDVVRRRPALFVEQPGLAGYFGDPGVLEAQMRGNLQVGEQHPGDAGAYALEAYCAWVLKDNRRIMESLRRMVGATDISKPDAGVDAIRFALLATME